MHDHELRVLDQFNICQSFRQQSVLFCCRLTTLLNPHNIGIDLRFDRLDQVGHRATVMRAHFGVCHVIREYGGRLKLQ
ncbi:hypothetical protein FisN_18Lu192 [Fistulifera solaris]|uniref:Uncharacterized protein n=1 Tax=Fistulifera solaris TaxID=1519565 RepID=A0A1Z5JUM6_FISSO|nr:hypothetical protein FisN_18Lu192 [Fistulifera solaris]|eukprot:GAX17542.1 hypothetical protein FisN_18Lu192 [Fistulifera solaris]